MKDKFWVTPIFKDKFYVYAYYDLNGIPFYIGKGKDNRVNNHVKPSLRKQHSYKNHKINSIISKLGGVRREIVCYFDNENSALDMEEYLILSYGVVNEGGGLTNVLKHRNDMPKKVRSKEVRMMVAKKTVGYSQEIAEEIIAKYDTGDFTQDSLSKEYGISSTSVGMLLTGKTQVYSHIPRKHSPTKIKRFSANEVNRINELRKTHSISQIMKIVGISKTHLYRILNSELIYLNVEDDTNPYVIAT